MTIGNEFGFGVGSPDWGSGYSTGGQNTNTCTVRPGCREGNCSLNGIGPFGFVIFSAARGTALGMRTKAVFASVEKDSLLHRCAC